MWVNKTRIVRRMSPERYFTQNNLAVVIGWLRRNDFVFFARSLVKEIAAKNREKKMGRMI